MRFFTASLVALTTLVAAVFALENPISFPSAGDKIEAGKTYTIKWTPTSPDSKVRIVLREGDSSNLNVISDIVETPNSGTYSWTVPKNLVAGKDYAIEIVYKGGSNFSPQFEIDSTVTAKSTTDTTATTATTAMTSTTATTATTSTSATSTVTQYSTTESTTMTYSTLVTSITSAPNSTVTTTSISNSTSKPKTTTTPQNSSTGAPNPNNAGLARTVSGGLVVVAVAALAMML